MTTLTAPQRNVSADEAREAAEAAREQHWVAPSFVRDLFLGRLRMALIDPYPEQDPEEVRRAQPFLEQLERFLRDEVDSDKIDREGEIPDAVIEGLRALGAFGIKIPREYGGLGLSQLSYMKAIELVSSVDGSVTAQITAFIVEADWPGVAVVHRCHFMGLKAIYNGVMRFTNVRVPKENVLWGEGKGLKLALTTLNTGRLTLPISSVAAGKRCLEISREWANERIQWGRAIGKHDAIAQKIGAMAANTFAMEAVAELCGAMADRGSYDIRLEAAIAKLYNSEAGWRIIDETVQIRGGRGYETADSLRARGEKPVAVERIMRDFRINLIFEGSSEIMHLFIAREAVDKHLQIAGDVVMPGKRLGERLRGLVRAALFYGWWYPSRWLGWGFWPKYTGFGPLAKHLRYVERAARRRARGVFHAMMRFGPKLEYRQALRFRLVDVGAELFAMAATCARAERPRKSDPAGGRRAVDLADLFCRQARGRVDAKFRELSHNADTQTYRLAQEVLQSEHRWLERGMVELSDPQT